MANILAGLATGAVSGLASTGLGLLGNIGSGKRSRELLAEQEAAQSRLNAQNAELNYNYGEQAADAAHQRSLGLLKAETEANSYVNQVQDIKNAGLNVGLLYGGAGAGGGASAGGGAQGGGAGNQKGQAGNYLEIEALKQQRKMANAELLRTVNESRLVDAERKNIEADTKLKDEKRMTSEELTPLQLALTKEEGIEKWIENARKMYENTGGNHEERSDPSHIEEHEIFGILNIGKEGGFSQRQAAEIAELMSSTEGNKAAAALDTERKRGYWQELLNAKIMAENDKVKAAAIKLAAEWSTGEFKNWKTWVATSTEAANAIGGLIKAVP